MKDINYIVGFVLSGIIILITLIAYISEKRKFKKLNKEIKEEKEKIQEDWLKEAQQKYLFEIQDKINELNSIEEKIKEKENEIIKVEKELSEKKNFNSSLLKIREEELNRLIEEKRQKRESELEFEIEEWAQSAQEAATYQRDQIFKQYQKDIDEQYEKLRNLYLEINEYKEKRDAMNQEIMRARAIEEKQDFYRIQIPDGYRHDIELLNEIRSQFSKIEILDKLIYDNYIKKPVDEMIKRILGGRAPSGIYKITRLKTGEVYIGKSTDVKTRIQQHCKTCYHCGTISRSTLHDVMDRDKIWNFTFELLEEVPKEKLGEREKYWINFYDSKKFGLNEKNGG